MRYDPSRIEKKWQKEWEKKKTFSASDESDKPKWYSLVEFPYPSGAGMHVGHLRSYTGLDVLSRKRRMQGYNVLFPMGWDAFGLPTENYAIKTGISPQKATKQNTDNFRKQLKSIGLSFDWAREVDTTDPDYYKWTQWIFQQFFKAGLAYKTAMNINWCPKDKIGLANEEVVGGKCERCGSEVEQRKKEQWMLKITAYADKLIDGLKDLDYLPEIRAQQENWIGRSEGAEIDFDLRINKTVGATFIILNNANQVLLGLANSGIFNGTWRFPGGKFEAGEGVLESCIREIKEEMDIKVKPIGLLGFCNSGKNTVNDVPVYAFQMLPTEKPKITEPDKIQEWRWQSLDGAAPEKLSDLATPVFEMAKKMISNQKMNETKGIRVFTTRTDTILGATYLVLSPEHPLIENLKLKIENWTAVSEYVSATKLKSDLERTENKSKTGVELKGIKAINPATKEEIPVWISDYVLSGYGTGAIMAVPQHDERDRVFAEKFKLPIVDKPFVSFDEAIKMTGGKKTVQYKLRDWVFSRQRYWGEPIPLIYCAECANKSAEISNSQLLISKDDLKANSYQLTANPGWVAVPEEDLPVKLPKVEKYEPTDNGESPLSTMEKWVKTKCPNCKGPARRETDTMPNWAGSSWYFLAYLANKEFFKSPASLATWNSQLATFSHFMPVDWYNGGMEHVTLHLLYSRFWNQFLFDQKLVSASEPYKKRTAHGMILATDGKKMSKSLGNVVNPDDLVKEFGADAVRLYILFIAPFSQSASWDNRGVLGTARFLEKVWRTGVAVVSSKQQTVKSDEKIQRLLHRTIKKVGEDIESMSFNTAVSSMMIFINELSTPSVIASEAKQSSISLSDWQKFLIMLSPFAPHIAEELYSLLTTHYSLLLCEQPWPEYDPALLVDANFDLIVQVNSKVRGKIKMARGSTESQALAQIKADAEIAKWLTGEIKKVVFIADRLINIIV